jgi:hypothetical protein
MKGKIFFLKFINKFRNAVTPIGMKTDIPIILCESITKLQPNYFWLGGGEVDVCFHFRNTLISILGQTRIINT